MSCWSVLSPSPSVQPQRHRPSRLRLLPSAPRGLRRILIFLLEVAVLFLQLVQRAVLLRVLQQTKTFSQYPRKSDPESGSGVWTGLFLAELVHRVTVDFAVRVAGHLAGSGVWNMEDILVQLEIRVKQNQARLIRPLLINTNRLNLLIY